jgi:DNA-binding PadR family transcriptional regulator
MSGYDLGQIVRLSVGHIWSESYGQIYPNLKRLAAAGLVNSKTRQQKGKPERRIYSITRKGREHLAQWLLVEPQPEIPRNEMLLKLFFGAHADPATLIGYVERMVEVHRALLQRFKHVEQEESASNRQYPDARFWKMTARYGQMEMEAHLAWAQEALAELRRIARQQGNSRPQKHGGGRLRGAAKGSRTSADRVPARIKVHRKGVKGNAS